MTTALWRWTQAFKKGLRRWSNSETGVSAVEFAFFAPALCLSLVAMADIGAAVTERMAVNHILRSGAQQAMSDIGVNNVLATIKIAGEAQNFHICSGPTDLQGKLCPEVSLRCYCPNQTDTNCTLPNACPANLRKTYKIVLRKDRDNMLLPNLKFVASIEVHVR